MSITVKPPIDVRFGCPFMEGSRLQETLPQRVEILIFLVYGTEAPLVTVKYYTGLL